MNIPVFYPHDTYTQNNDFDLNISQNVCKFVIFNLFLSFKKVAVNKDGEHFSPMYLVWTILGSSCLCCLLGFSFDKKS